MVAHLPRTARVGVEGGEKRMFGAGVHRGGTRRRAGSATLSVLLVAMATAATVGVTAGPAAANGTVVVVGPAGLPAALAAASPGETIVLKPGVYSQVINVPKDDITLEGSGSGAGGTVVTWPPALPPGTQLIGLNGNGDRVTNLKVDLTASPAIVVPGTFNLGIGTDSPSATGTKIDHVAVVGNGAPGETGIFVGGSDAAVRYTRTSGLGSGAITVAVNGATVADNTFSGNCADIQVLDLTVLGAGPETASHVMVQHNTVQGTEVCPGGPPAYGSGFGVITVLHAPYSTVRDNTVTGVNDLAIGADTQHLTVEGNTLRNDCIGVAVSDTGLPDGAGNATVADNEVDGTGSAACYPPGAGNLGTGIRIDGATNTTVVGNEVRSVVTTPAAGSVIAGIVVDYLPSVPPASNDVVRDNEVHVALGPATGYDMLWDGSGNPSFQHNECRTSSPVGLCTAD
jgi:hypothetical protein